MSRPLRVLRFSDPVRYRASTLLQEVLARSVSSDTEAAADTLVALVHHPVYTLGKRGVTSDLREPPHALLARGYDLHHAPRGGQTTYHGPGQVVLYPIVHLRHLPIPGHRGVRRFVEGLEDVMIHAG